MDQMLITQVILVFTSLTVCGLLFFVIRHITRGAMHLALTFQLLGIFGWTVTILLNLWHQSELIEMYIFAFACIALTAQLWFIGLFPDNHMSIYKKWYILIMTLVGAFFTIVSFVPDALFSSIEVTKQGYTIIAPGFLSTPYTAFAFVAICSTIVMLYNDYKKQHDQLFITQSYYLLIGFAIFFVVSLATNLVLPVLFSIYFFNAIGPIFSVFLVGYIVYIIANHQFLDIRVVVQRGLIYTAIFTFVVLIYSVVLAISSVLFSVNSIISDTLSCLIVTILALVTVPTIDTQLRKITDPIFFKDRYNYEEALHELSRVMQDTLDMNELLSNAEQTLEKILKARLVRIEGPQSEPQTDDLHIPIKLQDELVGNIIVAAKKSGEDYATQDIRLLRTFARQAAIAFGRVLLYQEVQERAEVLEEKVQERTTTLQTMQEKQKAMMLQLSHNLQTPLAILQTKIEGLRSQQNMKNTANSLSSSLHELSDFMSDLLHYARLDNQQDERVLHTENLSELARELGEEMNIIAESQSVTMHTDITDELYVQADKRQLREALTNVLSNALKYIGGRDPRQITLALMANKNDVVCTVSDTGMGIAPENLERIFDQFYRPADNAVKGTGLGLAITKKIIEQHGGTITATSKLGMGSTFTITLPTTDNDLRNDLR